MLTNYFKIALRSLLRNKLYTFINIAGLTIGMTCFILIALYIQYEMNYDANHEKAHQIYRVAQIQKGNTFQGSDRFAVTPMPLATALKTTFPEVQAALTLQVEEAFLSNKEQVFNERGLFSESAVFEVFTFPMLEGIGKEALKDPNTIILTQSLAKKYFANENPIGKTLLFQNERPLVVKGIIKDNPKNQHLTFDYITSFKNLPYYSEDDINRWNSNNYRTYVVLPVGYDYKQLEKKMKVFDPILKIAYQTAPFQAQFFLQPLKDIHLYSHINFELEVNSDIRYIYLFASIAFIILLLASINYMNLATARSATRAKEIGMRKVLGARKGQLVYQLLGESFLLTIMSFVVAILLVDILLPAFNQLLNKAIPFSLAGNSWLLIGMLFTALLVGGLSGLYPAFFLSAVAPVKAFRGGFLKNYKDGSLLRNALVVGQFTAAIVLGIGSVIIYQQLQYIQNKKLGYNREQVIFLSYPNLELSKKGAVIRREVLKHPQINKVSFTNYMPLFMGSQGIVNNWEGNTNKEDLWIYRNNIDYDFIDLFEMKMKEGRNFSPDFSTDSTESYILNEAAVKALGWKSAIDKQFNGGRVVGVVKDFHFQPFSLAIEPLYMTLGGANYSSGNIAIKVKMGDLDKTIAQIQQTMKAILPQLPFEYEFMDEAYNQLYESEQRFGQAFNIFSLLALFIGCMGLFGLASHNVVQRTKEIGIRKVLGASVNNIVTLLSKDFLKLVAVALIVAVPLAWFFMNKWLQNFVYRIDIQWWVFALAGSAAIGVALLTISVQAIRAAVANPVESLKNE